MKTRVLKYALLLAVLWTGASLLHAQTPVYRDNRPPTLEEGEQYRVKPVYILDKVIIDGDTMAHITLQPVIKYAHLDLSQHARLIRNLKKVYPIAKFANMKLREMEATLATMGNSREQDRYAKEMEKELKDQFTPLIRQMSISQGRILIKLIDRETGETSYRLVQELRGNFSAFFWQGIARIFGHNLKAQYDAQGEDRLIEQLINLYEVGLL